MEQIKLNYNIYVDYIILVFVILWSGGGVTYGCFPYWPYILFPVFYYVFIKRKNRIDSLVFLILLIVFLFLVLQTYYYNGDPMANILPFTSLLSMYLVSKICKDKIYSKIVNIIYFFSAISLLIWVLCLLPTFYNVFDSLSKTLPQFGINNLPKVIERGLSSIHSLYFFSFDETDSYFARNAGPFWEPGLFSLYLNVALVFNLFILKKRLSERKNIIFIITNITTFSTTGYLVLFLILFAYFKNNYKTNILKFVYIFILLTCLYYAFNLDFMSEKIINQSLDTENTESRIGAMYYHIMQISEHPFLGYGENLSLVWRDLHTSPNGITSFIRYWGVPMSIIFFSFFIFNNNFIKKNNKSKSSFLIPIVLIVSAFSQTVLMTPFYYLIYFKSFSKYD